MVDVVVDVVAQVDMDVVTVVDGATFGDDGGRLTLVMMILVTLT